VEAADSCRVMSLSLGMLLVPVRGFLRGRSLDVGIEDRGWPPGMASRFNGRQAANGELFDMEALTAAHRTLPLGSVVRVVNLANGKHPPRTDHRRGPYVHSRILDLFPWRGGSVRDDGRGLSVVRVQLVGERRPASFFL